MKRLTIYILSILILLLIPGCGEGVWQTKQFWAFRARSEENSTNVKIYLEVDGKVIFNKDTKKTPFDYSVTTKPKKVQFIVTRTSGAGWVKCQISQQNQKTLKDGESEGFRAEARCELG